MAKANGYFTSAAERLSYGTYFFGQNLFYSMVAKFLLTFYTDIGIAATTVALMMFVAKLWDAVNDPLFGGIMDKMRFKNAKFLPWLRISLPFILIATVSIYAVPSGLSIKTKIIWSLVAYMLYDTFYTMCDAPIYGLVTTMTTNQKERNSIMIYGRIFAAAGSVVPGFAVPMIRQPLGGWLPITVIISVVGFATMLPICFTAKERAAPPPAEKGYTVKEIIFYITHNKYLLVFYAALLFSGITGFTGAYGMYFARYCLGDEAKLGTMSLAGMPFGLAVLVVFPFLCRRFDKFKLYFWSFVAIGVLHVIGFFVGYKNFTAFLIVKVMLLMIPVALQGLLQFMFTPDCVEYGTYKTGINASGMAFSLQTFTAKLIAAINSTIAALALSAIGFVVGEGAVQLPGFADKLWAISAITPILGAVILLLILHFYKLRDHDVQLMAKANSGEITREEAEAGFTNKF